MKINFEARGLPLREPLRGRLANAAHLRCSEHGAPVAAVMIHQRENGWFDAIWTTCCDHLREQAEAIVKQRC